MLYHSYVGYKKIQQTSENNQKEADGWIQRTNWCLPVRQGVEEQCRGGELEAQTAGYKIGSRMYHTNREYSQYFVITVNGK